MAIIERTKRLLWARSGGFCQNPSCVRDLFVLFEDGSVSSIDELAHIIAQSVDGPRGHESDGPFDRDGHDNIVILCPSCHAIVDKNEKQFPTSMLRAWKERHERKLRDVLHVPVFKTRAELSALVHQLLRENYAIFEAFGPHSEHACEPLTDAAAQWRRRVVATILPSNRRILAILKVNDQLLTEPEKTVVGRFSVHQEAFEYNHVSGDKNAAAPLFPSEMNAMLLEPPNA